MKNMTSLYARSASRAAWLALLMACAAVAPSPAYAQIAVLTNTVEERIAGRGEGYRGSIIVLNTTGVEQRVRIYQTDYTFSADGTSDFAEVGSLPRSNAAWVTPSAQMLVIPPNAQLPIAYTVRVPSDSGLSGTYWSTIMVEGTAGRAPAERRGSVGLASVIRYAVQVATHIQASGSRKVQFSSPLVGRDSSNHRSLELVLTNVGERGYRPVVWVELYDGKGELRGKVEQTRGLLYPGTSLKQTFVFADLPAGTYKAIIFADTGDDAIFATQHKLAF